jgi:hypothetical protein
MKETKNDLKKEIAGYIEGLPESRKMFHKVMTFVEVLGMGIIVIAFVIALYFSFAWKSVNPMTVPLAWFAFAASGSLLIMFNGVHSAVLHAFPTGILPSKSSKFITGSKATLIGLALIIGGFVYAAFWGVMGYATVTTNFDLLRPLISVLGIFLGFGIAISILVKMVSTTLKKLS